MSPRPAPDPDEVVRREARTGKLVAVAAVASIVATLASITVSSRRPTGQTSTGPEDQVRLLETLHADPGVQWLSLGLRALGLLLLVGVGFFLARAIADRDDRRPTAIRILAVAGPLALIGTLVAGLTVASGAADEFFEGARTPERAQEVFADSTGVRIVGVAEILAHAVFAAWVVTTCFAALRVGLLSRTIAYWGMIAGVAGVMLSIGDTLFTGWLGAVAALAWGWWPGEGRSAAWTTGRAVPWEDRRVTRRERESM